MARLFLALARESDRTYVDIRGRAPTTPNTISRQRAGRKFLTFHNFHPPRVSLLLPLLLCGLHIPPILIAVFQREQNQRHQPTLASRPLMSSAASSDFSPHPPSQVSSFPLFFLFSFSSGVPSVDAPGLFACISDTVPSAKRARSAYIYYIYMPASS